MEDFTLAELGVFCGVIASSLVGLIAVFQKSKCDRIKCCGTECHRKPNLRTESEEPPTPNP